MVETSLYEKLCGYAALGSSDVGVRCWGQVSGFSPVSWLKKCKSVIAV